MAGMVVPSLIDRVRSRLTGTDPSLYAVRREARRDLVTLRDRERKAVNRLEESVLAWDQLVQPWQRYMDGAALLNPYGGWMASGTVADHKGGKNAPLFWSEPELRQFRWLSRLLCDTNPFALGFLGHLVGFHVRAGFGWQACRRGSKKGAYDTGGAGEADPDVRECQTVLDEFRDRANWPLRSREAFRRARRDGEVFLRLGVSDRGGPPWVRFVEPEQVGPPPGVDTEGPWSFGILTDPDDVETVLAYYVRDADGDGSTGVVVTASLDVDVGLVDELTPRDVRVIRGTILHHKCNVDSSVKRGLPDFFPVQQDLERVSKLLKNMAEVAAVQAAIAWVEKYATATVDQVRAVIQQGQTYERPAILAPGGTAQTLSVRNYEGGSVIHADGQREKMPGPVATGVPGFVQVEQAVLRACGVRWGMPEFFSGDASNNNMASSFAAGSPFVTVVEGGQLVWGAYERDVAVAVLSLCRTDSRRVDVEVTPPAVALQDKSQDTQRRLSLVQAKVMSITTCQLQEQLDPKHEAANQKAEKEREAAEGGQGQQGGGDDGQGGGGGELFGEGVVREGAPGPPPRPGLVWNDATRRWRHPVTGVEHEHGSPAAAVWDDPPPHEPDFSKLDGVMGKAEFLERRVAAALDAAGPAGVPIRVLVRHINKGGTVYGDTTPNEVAAVLDSMGVEYAGEHVRHASPVAESRTYTVTLSEADAAGKVMKVITYQRGGKTYTRKQLVNAPVAKKERPKAKAKPEKPARPAKADPAAVQREVAAALADPNLTAEAAAGLGAKLKTLTVPQLQAVQKELGVKGGGVKQDRVDKLVSWAKGKAVLPPPPPDDDLALDFDDFDLEDTPQSAPSSSEPDDEPDDEEPERSPNPALGAGTRPRLTANELAAVVEYSGSAYEAINADLRAGRPPSGRGHDKVHAGLRAAFAKAPVLPEPVTVYRGVDVALMPAEARDALVASLAGAAEDGGTVTMAGYVSTTTDKSISFLDGADMVMTIKARRGLDLRPHSHSPEEDELLLDHGSEFRVAGFKKVGGTYHVELEQVV